MWNGRYNKDDTVPLWDCINYAEEAHQAFATKDSFEKHCDESGLNGHPIENMVEMLLVPVKRLRSYQICQRVCSLTE